MKKDNIFKSRRFKHGTLATVMTVVFVAAIVLVNIIATILLEKFPLNIDLTKDQSYVMSDESKDFLKKVDKEITITFIGSELELTNGYYSGNTFYDTQALNTMKQCTQYNPKIKLEFVDLSKNPQYSSKFSEATISNGSVIVESDLRYKVVQYTDMYDINYDNYYSNGGVQIENSHVEGDLLSAIMYVTDTAPIKIGMLTNNNPVGSDGLKKILTQNNYSFVEINLLTQDIPKDVDLVLIAAPTTDYTKGQVEKLEAFMNNGGEYGKKLFYMAYYKQKELPNLEGYLASDWGIQVGKGMLYETDDSNMYMSPYYGLQLLTGEIFTEKMETITDPIIMPGARPLTLTFESSGATTTTPVIKSSATSVIQPVDADESWDPSKETQATHVLAAASTRLKYEEETNDEQASTVVVFGGIDFFAEEFLTWDALINGEFTVEMFRELSGRETETLNIVPKYEHIETFTATTATANVILVIFVVLLPLAVFVTGLVIWFRRRHR